MAECRDFFDDSAPRRGRSSFLCANASPSKLLSGRPDAGSHFLDLTLGLSNFSSPNSASPPRQQQHHEMVRAAPASFLHRQSNGNCTSSLQPATTDASQTSYVQGDGNGHVGPQQRSGNLACTDSDYSLSAFGRQTDLVTPSTKALFATVGNQVFPSRDQIWQALQKSDTLVDHIQQHSNAASSMWGRRAASMQVVLRRNSGDDSEQFHQIRRSCSNGVLAQAISHQLSNTESSVDSPQWSTISSQHPHQEALEDLQKRKEMQAQRRMEARKRRKILTEEKQHKKGRHSNALLPPCSRQGSSSEEKFFQGGEHPGEDSTAPESHGMSHDDLLSARLYGLKKSANEGKRQEGQEDSKSTLGASSNEESDGLSQDMQSKGGKFDTSVHVYGKFNDPAMDRMSNHLSSEYDLGSHSSIILTEFGRSGFMGGCPVASTLPFSSSEHRQSRACGLKTMPDHERISVLELEGGNPSASSETDCIENSGAPTNAAKEGGGVGGTIPASLSNSSPMGCSPLVFSSSIQYAYSTAASVSSAGSGTNQMVLPFPHFMQFPLSGNSENDPSGVQRDCPSITKNFMGVLPPMSGTFLSRTNSATKDSVGDFEGKRGSSEIFAISPLPRTMSNSKHFVEEQQYQDKKHIDFQASLGASQLSSTTNMTSDGSSNKTLSLERQPSRPLGGRQLSQNSGIEEPSLCPRQARNTIPCHTSVPMFESPVLRLGSSNANKQEEGVIMQEDGSLESQLASEHSGLDASYVQSGVVEKQRSVSFSHLPWVTTTGKGPNGKTITGVLYIANGRHVCLICSCHGKHMSPVEFVEHSGSSDLSNPERNIVVSPSPQITYQVASTPV